MPCAQLIGKRPIALVKRIEPVGPAQDILHVAQPRESIQGFDLFIRRHHQRVDDRLAQHRFHIEVFVDQGQLQQGGDFREQAVWSIGFERKPFTPEAR
jgi:hypothetical protein